MIPADVRAAIYEAVQRPARELRGYGETSDAHHMSTPHPEGEGARRAMEAALGRAGLEASAIDYVNLHGTASPANDVAEGRAEAGVVACWTGTGASIAANKVPGVRAALCADAETARGARKWNDANVLALSLRTTSPAVLDEILDAWFGSEPSVEADDRANVAHLGEIS